MDPIYFSLSLKKVLLLSGSSVSGDLNVVTVNNWPSFEGITSRIEYRQYNIQEVLKWDSLIENHILYSARMLLSAHVV